MSLPTHGTNATHILFVSFLENQTADYVDFEVEIR